MSDIDFSEYFYYDETSPSCLRWKVDVYTGSHGKILLAAAGSPAGSLGQIGYWKISVKDRTYNAHRAIMKMANPEMDESLFVDHINHIRSDNRLCNLRLVTHSVNMRNRRMNCTNYSGIPGVQFSTVNGYDYACSTWRDINGKSCKKSFGFKRYGMMPAIAMAVAHRKTVIKCLNAQGAGYSELHGAMLEASSQP